MNTIRNIINELESLKGSTIVEYGREITLPKEVDKFRIDLCEFLGELEGYECDLIKSYYDENGEETQEEASNIDDYLLYLNVTFGLEEDCEGDTKHYRSSPSHDFIYEIYKSHDNYFLRLSVHKFGDDIKANYTQDVLLELDKDKLYELFYENRYAYKYVPLEIEGKKYKLDINLWYDEKDLYDYDYNLICSTFEEDEEEILSDLREKLA